MVNKSKIKLMRKPRTARTILNPNNALDCPLLLRSTLNAVPIGRRIASQ